MVSFPSPFTIIGFIWEHFFEIITILFLLFIIFLIFFRRYLSALIYDYLDGVISYVDYALVGAGAIGFDFGDWIVALIIFIKEKKISGKFPAMLAAWEATNFIPFSLIPVLGEILEIFLGFFPAVTIIRIMFNKYRPAEKKEHMLEEHVSIAEQLGLDVWREKRVLKEVKELIKKANPVDALKEVEKANGLSSKLTEYTDSLIADAHNTIQYITSQNIQAPQEIISILQEGINQGLQLLQQSKKAEENKDFGNAINYATNAKNIVMEAAQKFDSFYQQYLYNLQNQMQ